MENIDDKSNEKRVGYEKALYTKIVWAGRRRYFFDVLSTRSGDKYISITESRKKNNPDGSFVFDNQKLFLFKEDFIKFSNGLSEVISFIEGKFAEERGESNIEPSSEISIEEPKPYTADDVDFDSL